jgi:hypothetical protein
VTIKGWVIELIALLITLALWMAAMLHDSPWWILIAMVGSGLVLFGLCYLALKH